jgi:septal ring factor EnvC (AmiA/AmiB activator)
MSSSLEQLKAERGALAQRLSDSQREVQQIREALKAQQDKLSLLEAQKGEHVEQLAKVAQLISDAEAKSAVVGPELTARLIGPLL